MTSESAVLSYNIESYSCEITTFTKLRILELGLAALSYDYTSKYDQTEWWETRMYSVQSLSTARLGTSKCSLNQNSLYELPNASPRPYSAVLIRFQTYSYMRIGWLWWKTEHIACDTRAYNYIVFLPNWSVCVSLILSVMKYLVRCVT